MGEEGEGKTKGRNIMNQRETGERIARHVMKEDEMNLKEKRGRGKVKCEGKR